MKAINKYLIGAIVILWTIACFVFFQWFYLNHLFYRLQLQLFLYSADYLNSYFQQPAWLASLVGDFLTQFFYFNYAGALTITLSLLLLGVIFYSSLGRFFTLFNAYSTRNVTMWVWLKLLITLGFITWEAMRSCGLNYELSSTLSLIGGLLLFRLYAACLCKKWWLLILGLLLLPFAYWLFGYGIWLFLLFAVVFEFFSHRYWVAILLLLVALPIPALLRPHYHFTFAQAYRYPAVTFFDSPDLNQEKLLEMDAESSFGHWNRVLQLTEKVDFHSSIVTYFYNLSHGMCGTLPDQLLRTYQPGPLGLLVQLSPQTPTFAVWCSNEAWFQLGDMTMAEHSALLAMIFSPNHRSARMVKRLAEINMVNGDTEATMKYLRLLQKTWLYKEWAEQCIPGKESPQVKSWLEKKRTLIPVLDTLRATNDQTLSLRALLNSHRDNKLALDYLLCYDLLSKDIKAFMDDYDKYRSKDDAPNRLYSQGLLIGLMQRKATIEEVKHYAIFPDAYNDFMEYTHRNEAGANGRTLQPQYGKTYWFYYQFATFSPR
jgi:hypothetical protein